MYLKTWLRVVLHHRQCIHRRLAKVHCSEEKTSNLHQLEQQYSFQLFQGYNWKSPFWDTIEIFLFSDFYDTWKRFFQSSRGQIQVYRQNHTELMNLKITDYEFKNVLPDLDIGNESQHHQ